MNLDTPGEVEVARDWLKDVIGYLSWPIEDTADLPVGDYVHSTTGPFDAVNNETYFSLVYEWGIDQPTATAVSFMSRRATWELMWP